MPKYHITSAPANVAVIATLTQRRMRWKLFVVIPKNNTYAWLLILGTGMRNAAPVSVRLSKIGVTMIHRVTCNIFTYSLLI